MSEEKQLTVDLGDLSDRETEVDERGIASMLAQAKRKREDACTAEAMGVLGRIMEKHNCDLEILVIYSSMAGQSFKLNFVAK